MIKSALPVIYEEDELLQRFIAGLDDAIDPVIAIIDCIDGYFSSSTAPEDFLRWLKAWFDRMDDFEDDNEIDIRRLIDYCSDLMNSKGTINGLRLQIFARTGIECSVKDNGYVNWSHNYQSDFGAANDAASVDVTIPNDVDIDDHQIEQIIVNAKPAHVLHQLHRVDEASS